MFADQFRVLTFRAPSSAVSEHPRAYLVFGLITAWAAGIGRYWDNPRASAAQHYGVGSVVYVPILAWLLWFVAAPLAARKLTYFRTLVFVSLTSLPAVLYAIPVEQFLAPGAARAANAWFLGVVAAWRVALLVAFLRAAAGIRGFGLWVAVLYPLVFVVAVLALLNLERAAFDIMSGIRNTTAQDRAYEVVLVLTSGACWLFLPLTIAYFWLLGRAVRRRAPAAGAETANPDGKGGPLPDP